MKNHRYTVVDVFTDRPMTGNQLAVFTNGSEVPDSLLQPLAREMNFSETVFVYPRTNAADARMRIFTPVTELPFAGHPILGTAFVLASLSELDEIRLQTGAGVVAVRIERVDRRPVFGWMTQPVPTVRRFKRGDELLALLDVQRSALPIEIYDNGVEHLYVMLDSEAAVGRLRPDAVRLAQLLPKTGAHLGIRSRSRRASS
jgi:trans-2,3-dihydro-3-hydroxyanthranilate isomerase